jgi:hypothetical protein
MSTSSWCSQASGPWADVVRGAIEACRLEAREKRTDFRRTDPKEEAVWKIHPVMALHFDQ